MIILKKQRVLHLIIMGWLVFGTAPILAGPDTNPSTRNLRTPTRVLFTPPPDDQKPEQTRGAGSRHEGQCSGDTVSESSSTPTRMIPLVPSSNYGLTTAQRPIFWVYLPETSARQVVLSIREGGKTHHSQTFIPISGKSGLIGLQPNADAPPLQAGKVYQWAVVLVCQDKPSPNDPAIASWVGAVVLSKPLQKTTPLEQADWYAQQGYWYDAVTSLVEARRSQPNNQELANIWVEFLESGGMTAIATALL